MLRLKPLRFVLIALLLVLFRGAVSLAADTAPLKKSEMLWQDLQNLKTVDVGPADAPVVFIVVDPLCPFCGAYWKDLDQALQNGAKLRVRFVLVGTISCESLTVAEQIYAADNPPDAWRKVHETENNPNLRLPTPAAADIVQNNQNFFTKWKLSIVPFTIYKSKTSEVRLIRAKPDSLNGLLSDIGTP